MLRLGILLMMMPAQRQKILKVRRLRDPVLIAVYGASAGRFAGNDPAATPRASGASSGAALL